MKAIHGLALLFLIWSVSAFAQEIPFQFTHRGSILEVRFSPDGSRLVSYSSGNQDMCMWDVQSGRLLWKRPISFIQKSDEYYTLDSIAWSSDQKLIATGSGNGTVQLWEADTGRFLWRAEISRSNVTAVGFSPDGKVVAAAGLAKDAGSIKLVNVEDGTILKTFEGSACTPVRIAFDSTGENLRIGNLDGNVGIWDLASGKQTARFTTPCYEMRAYDWTTSFSSDLGLIASESNKETVILKDTISGDILKSTKANDSKVHTAVSGPARSVVISEYDGFHLHNLKTGEERVLEDCFSGNAIDLSDDGRLFARGCDVVTAIKVTDVQTGRTWNLDGHPGTINATTFSPDYKVLAVAGGDGNIYLFDQVTRQRLKMFAGQGIGLTAIAFDPDGKTLIAGDGAGVIRIWDIASGKSTGEFKPTDRRNDVQLIQHSPDGTKLLVGINHPFGSLQIWDRIQMKPIGAIATEESYESTSGNMTLVYSSVPISSAAFTIDGKSVLTGHEDGSVRLFATSTLKQTKSYKLGESVLFVIPTRDGNNAVAVVRDGYEKYKVLQLSLRDGSVIKRSKTIDLGFPERAAISPDGKWLIVAGNIGDVRLFNLADMTFTEIDHDYSGGDSIAFSADSKTVFLGGDNQNLALYDLASRNRMWQLIPSFVPSAIEEKLKAEKTVRVKAIREAVDKREKQAAIDRKSFAERVSIRFEHFGTMSDPGEKRMVEKTQPNESNTKTDRKSANAVWLRLVNDSPLPIHIPTQSMYMPNPDCTHAFPNGEKIWTLCKESEVSIWFGLEDKNGKDLPYGFDFGSSAILRPGDSTVFAVPLKLLDDGNSIVFNYSFQNVKASENDREFDYGKPVELRFNSSGLPK